MNKMKTEKIYIIVYILIILLLTAAVNLYFFERHNKLLNIKKQKYIKDFYLQRSILEYRLKEMFNSIYLQRQLIEKYYNDKFQITEINNIDYNIKHYPEKGLYLINVSSNFEKGDIVFKDNIISAGNISLHDGINKLIKVIPLQHLLIKKEEFVGWIVFYTPDYFSIVPGIDIEEIKSAESVFNTVKDSLESVEKETDKNIYEDGWETSIFRDQSDEIFMFSKNLPVKNNEKIIGILSSNINIESLENYIKNNGRYNIYISNSYQDIVYLNGRKYEKVRKLKKEFKDSVRDKFKFSGEEINIFNINNSLYITAGINGSSWNLIFENKNYLTVGKNYYIELFILNLTLLIIFTLIFNLLRKNIDLEKEKKRILKKEANYDSLTELYKRNKFFAKAELIFDNAQRGNIKFAVAMLDLDDFKDVNDKYGHLAGDRVLKEIGEIINNNIRKTDIAARFGGEEFCILLNGVNSKDAYNTVEKIRKKIAEHTFNYNDKEIKITISAGLASKLLSSLEKMINHADKNLYKAKNKGKNIVVD